MGTDLNIQNFDPDQPAAIIRQTPGRGQRVPTNHPALVVVQDAESGSGGSALRLSSFNPDAPALELDGSSVNQVFALTSSFNGGENTYDSTSRIQLQSYQRWQKHNDANDPEEAHYGEVIRVDLMRDNAKGVIAWRDGFTDPENPYTVAGWVAHYEANDGNSVHGHLSLEVVDSDLLVQTRFEVRFVDEEGTIGVDQCLIKTSDSRFVVGCDNGALHVAASVGTAKNMYFNNNSHGLDTGKRWGLQTDSTAEGGSNAGSDFRINRYTDAGAFVDSPLTIRRSTGAVGIGITAPSSVNARLDVSETGTSRHSLNVEQTTTSATNFSPIRVAIGLLANRYLDCRVSGDSTARFVVKGDGTHEFGDGSAGGRDTGISRPSTAQLRITPTGNASNSSSVGGALNITNTSSTGAGLVVYSTQASPTGHLVVARANNATFNQNAVYAEYVGTSHAVSINHQGTGTSSSALNIASTNTSHTALGVSGVETDRGTVKITHTGTGTDTNAAGLSIDLAGSGTAAQGVYVDATGGGTTGRLLRLRNNNVDKLTVSSAGQLLSADKVLATGGIGVGNSASASSLGTLSKKMEVFDAAGASLGFVPIYTSIT